MSFQAYLDNIAKITQSSIEQIYEKAVKDGVLMDNLKATEFVSYLATTYGLGRGHSMALWKYFIEKQWVQTKHTTI